MSGLDEGVDALEVFLTVMESSDVGPAVMGAATNSVCREHAQTVQVFIAENS